MPIHNGKTAKAIGIGTAAALIAILLMLCLICGVLMMMPTIPKDSLPYIVLIADAVGAFVGGCIAAALTGSGGLIVGLYCGISIFVSLLIFGLLGGSADVGAVTFIRLGVLILFGMIGGIKGVNRKEKLHIK